MCSVFAGLLRAFLGLPLASHFLSSSALCFLFSFLDLDKPIPWTQNFYSIFFTIHDWWFWPLLAWTWYNFGVSLHWINVTAGKLLCLWHLHLGPTQWHTVKQDGRCVPSSSHCTFYDMSAAILHMGAWGWCLISQFSGRKLKLRFRDLVWLNSYIQ